MSDRNSLSHSLAAPAGSAFSSASISSWSINEFSCFVVALTTSVLLGLPKCSRNVANAKPARRYALPIDTSIAFRIVLMLGLIAR